MSGHWPPEGLTRAVRDAARGTGWTAWSGTLSRVDDGIAVHVYEFAMQLRFLAKPVAWDTCLWRLLDIEAYPRNAASRHFRGVYAHVPALALRQLTARDGAGIAAEILDFAQGEAERVDRARLADFSYLLGQDADRTGRDDFAVTEAVWHLVEGRTGAAREIALAVARGARRPSYRVSATRDGKPLPFFDALLAETEPGRP